MTEIKTINNDDYANVVTGLAGPVDKNSYTRYNRGRILWEQELRNMYLSNALAARIVDRVVDDATREGFRLAGADKQFDFASLQSQLEDLDIMNIISKAWKQARLYGGCIIVIAVNDGRKYDEPLDPQNLTKIVGFRVIPAFRARPADFSFGMGSNSYLSPEHYIVQELNGKQKRIHWSRCIRIDGVPDVDDQTKLELNNGWGPSVLQRCKDSLERLGAALGYLSTISHSQTMMILQKKGFNEMVCGGDNARQDLQRMIESMMMTADNLHAMVLDADDSIAEFKRDVAGLSAIVDKFVNDLVMNTDLPRTILLGEQPGGLNAGADGEIRGYYDHVHSTQKNFLTSILTQIIELMFQIRFNKGEVVPDEWNIEFEPLWQPSEQEQSDVLLKNMQAYQIASQLGFMTVDEVRKKLISSGIIEESGVEVAGAAPQEAEQIVADEDAMASTEPVPSDLMSTREAAAMIGIPTVTLNNLLRKGEIRYWSFGSKKQVSMNEVMEYGSSHD